MQTGGGTGAGDRPIDAEVVRVGGVSVPPLGVNVVDYACNVMCLTRNIATRVLKVVGLPSLLPQRAGTL